MAYIRDNEDYYVSMGMKPSEARLRDEAERRCGHDGGYCNPRKAKEYQEALDEIRKERNAALTNSRARTKEGA